MAYEIDFIGVGDEVKKDADAITIRWKDDNGDYKIAVYDGGLQAHGEKMVEHLNEYYFSDSEDKIIDCVICSHSDLDHVSGLKRILEEFEVKKLYMNRPWLYIDDVWDSVNDGRITKESLCERLKKQYKYISELEEIAEEKNIELMIESNKTPLEKSNVSESAVRKIVNGLVQYVKNLIESWQDEKLREDVETTSENEMSVVVLGKMDEENFLLTGDAGIRALDSAIVYAEEKDEAIKDTVKFLQIPHHGGRRNVSPSILDRLIGEIVDEDKTIGKTAYVSVAKDSDHPLQMVVNAFTRRGVKVYKTEGNIIHHHKNMPDREGWSALEKLNFEEKVEEWDK